MSKSRDQEPSKATRMSKLHDREPVPPPGPATPPEPVGPEGPCPDPVGPDYERAQSIAGAFAKEYQELCEKYYGQLDECDWKPLAMKLTETIPLFDPGDGARITTTATVTFPLDSDDPMDDTAF